MDILYMIAQVSYFWSNLTQDQRTGFTRPWKQTSQILTEKFILGLVPWLISLCQHAEIVSMTSLGLMFWQCKFSHQTKLLSSSLVFYVTESNAGTLETANFSKYGRTTGRMESPEARLMSWPVFGLCSVVERHIHRHVLSFPDPVWSYSMSLHCQLLAWHAYFSVLCFNADVLWRWKGKTPPFLATPI